MNLDELQTVQSKERQKDVLQHLRPSFYKEVAEYLGERRAERERVAATAEDPFASPEVARLTDEIEAATEVVRAIYERRMGKIVKQASLAAAGMPADDEGLTAEERVLFEDLVGRIEENKAHVLAVIEGREGIGQSSADGEERRDRSRAGDATHEETGRTSNERDETGVSAAAAMGTDQTGGVSADGQDGSDGGETDPSSSDPAGQPTPASTTQGDEDGEPTNAVENVSSDRSVDAEGADGVADGESDENGEQSRSNGTTGNETTKNGNDSETDRSDDVDRMTVRLTCDVGSILGVDDREYTLAEADVVSLPVENARPLIEREAAEPLE